MALQRFFIVILSLIAAVSAESCDDAGSLRLVGWLEADAGRVEACRNGVWGTICVNESLDLWPHKNAEVACRDLGYAGALNSLFHHTIPGDKRVSDSEVPIHFSRVRCSGEQKSLLDCQVSEDTDQCTHNQDAAIVCRRGQASGDVRLMGDQQDTVGAVELYHPTIGWTGICADSNWRDNKQAAETVCAQLGYLGGTPYIQRCKAYIMVSCQSGWRQAKHPRLGHHHSTRNSRELLDYFSSSGGQKCLQRSAVRVRKVVVGSCSNGNSFDLTDCDISTIEDCSSDDLAWVQCSPTGSNGEASQLGSEEEGEGLMQIQYGGRRGFICDNDWDGIDARVACAEFGLHGIDVDTSPEGDYTDFISDLKPIWVGGIECTTRIQHQTNIQGGSSSERVIVESEIKECDRSEQYPIGLTACNFESKTLRRRRLAQVDCGGATTPLTSSQVALIAGIVVGLVFLCCCCTCFIFFCLDEKARRKAGRKTVCEKISGRDCCRVPGPVLHCVHTAQTRLKPSTRNHSEVADNIRPTNITTTNISQYTMELTTDCNRTVVSSTKHHEEPSDRSSVHHTPTEEQREWTSDAPPSYSQSSGYPIPSLSHTQTTV